MNRNIILFIITLLSISSCLNMPCETSYKDICISPNGNFKVISSSTDCGATTTPSYGYKIVETIDDENYDNRKNLFLGSSFGREIKWISNDTIVVLGTAIEEYYTRKIELIVSGKNFIIDYKNSLP